MNQTTPSTTTATPDPQSGLAELYKCIADLERRLTAALAELERVQSEHERAQRQLEMYGVSVAQLRADLAAAREEMEQSVKKLRFQFDRICELNGQLETATARAVEADGDRDRLRSELDASQATLEQRGKAMDAIEDAFGEQWVVKNREDGSFDWQASAVASIAESKYLAERFKKERGGAMHSSECWELMHAKRHEELEAMTARATEAEGQLDASLRREGVLREHLGEMLDEIRTTKRQNYWPSQLLCAECGCNVSEDEPHKPTCKIGLAIAAWDQSALGAGSEEGTPVDGKQP